MQALLLFTGLSFIWLIELEIAIINVGTNCCHLSLKFRAPQTITSLFTLGMDFDRSTCYLGQVCFIFT